MKEKEQTIDELISEFISYLESLKRAKKTIEDYRYSWSKVQAYMEKNQLTYYNKTVGASCIKSLYGNFIYNELAPRKQQHVNQIEALGEFQDTGKIICSSRMPTREFNGEIGECMLEYIAYRKSTFGSAERTIITYYINLNRFLVFLNSKGIKNITGIKQSDVYDFFESLDIAKLATKKVFTGMLKGFFSYLHSNEQLPNGLSLKLPQINYKNSARLPSTFTTDEISALLKCIDRASPRGKRDYAILLLAIKLGLRASDINGLKFENILWDKNLIKFTQKKTGKDITLPLLPEIGNAIIDYLKYGRPESTESYCFLKAMSPYASMHYSEVWSLTQQHLARSGIDLRGRKHGPHALRHSFASRLLEGKTPLPIISEAMGHSRTQSTMTYLRIDIDTLRQCALDVPELPWSFYLQRGGLS